MTPLTFRQLTDENGQRWLAVIVSADRATREITACLSDGTQVTVKAAFLTTPFLTADEFLAEDALSSKGRKSLSWFTQWGYPPDLAHKAYAIYSVGGALEAHLFKFHRDRILYASHCLDAGLDGEAALTQAAHARSGISRALEAHGLISAAKILVDMSQS